METDLHNHTPSRLLSFFFLLLIYYCDTGLAVSANYSLPNEYFINCGSTDIVTVGQTTFVGDSGGKAGAGFSFTSKDSSIFTGPVSSSKPALNQTARIFRASDSVYRFKITTGSLYFLRLHFSAFSGKDNLSESVFDISVPGRKLLTNFTVGEGTSTVEEFLVPIDKSGEFRLSFHPIGTSSFAFVNAVELFALPDGFIPGKGTRLTPQGENGNYSGINSQILHTKYRINVGGSPIAPEEDTLLRNWVRDDEYLLNPNASNTHTGTVKEYQPNTTNVTDYTAPRTVYSSARIMTVNSNGTNVTWRFDATVNTSYLVRFHFCDIVSISVQMLSMSLYVFERFKQRIYPYVDLNLPSDPGVPFKFDFVVDSGQDGYIQISIGNDSSLPNIDAYLNGLEIMEMIGRWDSDSVSSSNGGHLGVIIGVAVGGGLLLLFALTVLGLKCRRRPNKVPSEPSIWTRLDLYGLGSTQGKESGSDPGMSASPHLNLNLVIPLPEILSATKNYSDEIGKGGFGYVYRGTLRNQKVAVKRSYPGSSQGVSEFQTEIIVLSKIKHKHLVSLIGYCCEKSEMILVYEFMEKGTLKEHLYSSDSNHHLPHLPWNQRLEICIGAARGLEYLHTGTSEVIIHRDVKPTNILLDHQFTAKVADFGLSKFEEIGDEQSQVSRRFKGTLGYLDPQYLNTQVPTEKSDVYAFGVVLLEVLCARPPIDGNLPRAQMNLAEWVAANIDKGSLEEVIDPSIAEEITPDSLRKFVDTALKCLQEDDEDRPSMRDVIWDLEYALGLQKTTVQMGLLDDNTVTNGFSMSDFSASAIQKFPSISMSVVEMDDSIVNPPDDDDDDDTEVYSQLQNGDGR